MFKHSRYCASQGFTGGQGLEYIPCDCEANVTPLMSPEERQRLIRAPISVGILATTKHTGSASAGGRSDTPKVPVQNFRTGLVTGWMSSSAERG